MNRRRMKIIGGGFMFLAGSWGGGYVLSIAGADSWMVIPIITTSVCISVLGGAMFALGINFPEE